MQNSLDFSPFDCIKVSFVKDDLIKQMIEVKLADTSLYGNCSPNLRKNAEISLAFAEIKCYT